MFKFIEISTNDETIFLNISHIIAIKPKIYRKVATLTSDGPIDRDPERIVTQIFLTSSIGNNSVIETDIHYEEVKKMVI